MGKHGSSNPKSQIFPTLSLCITVLCSCVTPTYTKQAVTGKTPKSWLQIINILSTKDDGKSMCVLSLYGLCCNRVTCIAGPEMCGNVALLCSSESVVTFQPSVQTKAVSRGLILRAWPQGFAFSLPGFLQLITFRKQVQVSLSSLCTPISLSLSVPSCPCYSFSYLCSDPYIMISKNWTPGDFPHSFLISTSFLTTWIT